MKDFVLYSKEFELKELALAEKSLGNNEIVLCKSFSEKELFELKKELSEEIFSVNFFVCHLLYKNNLKELNKFKNKTNFIGVLGGTVLLNSFAASNKKVDFLFAPCCEGRLAFDTAIARTAKENKTEILIPFSQFLNSSYSKRVSLTKNYSFMLKLSNKFKLNTRVISFAEELTELRSMNDLESFKVFLEKKFESILK